MASSKEEDIVKAYRDIYINGKRSKHWKMFREVMKWLEGREEYEKCAELLEIKKGQIDNEDFSKDGPALD